MGKKGEDILLDTINNSYDLGQVYLHMPCTKP